MKVTQEYPNGETNYRGFKSFCKEIPTAGQSIRVHCLVENLMEEITWV